MNSAYSPEIAPTRQTTGLPILGWCVPIIAIAATAAQTDYLGTSEFVVATLAFVVSAAALRKPPRSEAEQILFFQLILLILLYPVKGAHLAWLLSFGDTQSLPVGLRFGAGTASFSTAYASSCAVVVLLASVLVVLPFKHSREVGHRDALNPQLLVKAVSFFFWLTLVMRMASFDGALGAVVYVANHRAAHFSFSLLVYILLMNSWANAARRAFLWWLGCGFTQFVLFGSKSYIFVPVVGIVAIWFFSQRLIVSRKSLILGALVVLVIYPVFNMYRSVALHDGGGGFVAFVNVLVMYASGGDGYGFSGLAANSVQTLLGRLVGFEWYLMVVQEASENSLPGSRGLLANLMSVNDVMRELCGLSGEKIGIAPSILGCLMLITRDPYVGSLSALILCFGFVLLHRGLAFMFPRLRRYLVVPIALVIFLILTDGVLASLYWEVPALVGACVVCGVVLECSRQKKGVLDAGG